MIYSFRSISKMVITTTSITDKTTAVESVRYLGPYKKRDSKLLSLTRSYLERRFAHTQKISCQIDKPDQIVFLVDMIIFVTQQHYFFAGELMCSCR